MVSHPSRSPGSKTILVKLAIGCVILVGGLVALGIVGGLLLYDSPPVLERPLPDRAPLAGDAASDHYLALILQMDALAERIEAGRPMNRSDYVTAMHALYAQIHPDDPFGALAEEAVESLQALYLRSADRNRRDEEWFIRTMTYSEASVDLEDAINEYKRKQP